MEFRMKGIFIGGCHLVGKPHGVSAGFVRRLWRQWRNLDKNVHFEMIPYAVEWAALFDACREGLRKKPDFLVLNIQSGLVLPTWDRTMIRLGIKNQKPVQDTENWFEPLDWKPQNRGRFYWSIKKMGILMLGGHREKWHWIEEEWKKLAQELYESKTLTIIMTPTPVNDEFFVHGSANLERVRKIVLKYKYSYEVYDAYEAVKTLGEEGLWLDGQHISREAHALIADQLWCLIREKGEYPCRKEY
jgi:hypothetical protein